MEVVDRISTDKLARMLFACTPIAGWCTWDDLGTDERDDYREEAAALRDLLHEEGYMIAPIKQQGQA